MTLRLPARRGPIIAIAALAVVTLGAAGMWLLTSGGKAASGKITTATVRRGNLTITASAAGTVQPVNSRALTFGAGGTVESVSVKAGDHVTAGQLLATIDPTEAQAAVTSAQSALDAANTNLTLARQQASAPTDTTTCTNVVPAGLASAGFVSAGFVSAGFVPAGFVPAGFVPAGFVLAGLLPAGFVPAVPSPSPSPSPSGPPSPGPAATPSPSTSIPHSGASSCANGPGGGQRNQNNTGTDPLLRAQEAVNNAELALEQAQARLAGTTISAPITGRVLSIAGTVGQAVSAGGSGFIVLGGVDSLAVLADFSEADVAAIAVGQKASVTLANHPGQRYAATVTQIDPAGTASGQLVRYGVELSFGSVPADLLLGQSADVAVTTASATNVLYVPTAALTGRADGIATVTVRTPTGDVTKTVSTGLAGDQGTEIRSGLDEGDIVVIVNQ